MSNSRFTLAIAKGESFCNRTREKNALNRNIENNDHTVIIATRRYGKTSLISEVIRINEHKAVWFDFLKTIDAQDVINVLCQKLSVLVGELTSDLSSIKGIIYKIFERYKPEFITNIYGQQLRFTLPDKKSSPEDISDLLLSVDKLAVELKKKVVVVCDEFQQMAEIDKTGVVQAAIRHAAERSENVAYVFSGSSRHMLEVLFMDKTKPLYRLCKIMKLHKIQIEHYYKFLTEAAVERWGKAIPEPDMYDLLIRMTERHPYYVNYLCLELWENEEVPDIKTIEATWENIAQEVMPYVKNDVKGLSANQKRVLTYLAKVNFGKTLDQETLLEIGVTNYSSAKQAIEYLVAKDVIYLDPLDNVYEMHDPVLRKYLS
jgi:AAA+ ATPase superfamily predicted ATPase|tara:strand:+ start:9548 stop:10669 length:1122 start_codon:yes stop_codon:yes gene_type:complete